MSLAFSVVVRARFERCVDGHDNTIPLAIAALTVAREEYPELDWRRYERTLATMARETRARCDSSGAGLARVEAIDEQLFAIAGFRGNSDGYYDPRNSFLNDVMDRQVGIPITLSIIYLELCWRLGVAAVGVGMPGHFLVRVDVGEAIYIDPFDCGTRLTVASCEAIFHRVHGDHAVFHPTMLVPIGRRQIMYRLLANLKGIYLQQKDHGRALAAIDCMLILRPDIATEYRDRAWVCQRIGHLSQAYVDYQTYLRMAPQAVDRDSIREALSVVRSECIRAN